MATTTLRFDITWENGNAIQLTRKEDAGEAITIVNMEENGDMPSIIGQFKDICKDSFAKALDRAGNEMVA